MRKLNKALLKTAINSLGKNGIEKLAIKTDLSRSTVERLSLGSMRNPTLETISKICQATELSFDELFPIVTSNEDEAA